MFFMSKIVRRFKPRLKSVSQRTDRIHGSSYEPKNPNTLWRDGMLTVQQEAAIQYLLQGLPYKIVAEKVGIGRVTLWEWRRWPPFQEEYRQARSALQEQTRNMLQRSTPLAIRTIVDLMNNTALDVEQLPIETPLATRLTAASKVLEMFFRGIEIEEVKEIQQSIAELQELLEPQKGLRLA
jgi:hypothetical protein